MATKTTTASNKTTTTPKKAVRKTAPKKATTKKATSKKKQVAKPNVADKQKATAKSKAPAKNNAQTHVLEGNPYRAGSYYATCFATLAKMGSKKPVSRKALLEAYCKASGKDEKRGRYDLAVIGL